MGKFMRRILVVFALTAVTMLFIFNGADWYAKNAALPRYCDNPQQNVDIVREILTNNNPAEGKERRPYIVAAKLIFLVPQEEGEAMQAYQTRLKARISEACGVRF